MGMYMLRTIKKFVLLCCAVATITLLTGCAPTPPDHIENICSIFKQYPSWYWDAKEVQEEWRLPISVLMAIIYQESHFQADAAPPRERILWVIPWKHPTSAYGYSQAINGTWKNYQTETNHHWSNRDAFGDAADFVGWFTHRAHVIAGISMNNAYAQYLAYHEGIDGYQHGSYRHQEWLIEVAHNVQRRARVYRSQLMSCQADLPKKPWWHSW